MIKKELDIIREQQAAFIRKLEKKYTRKVLKALHSQVLRFTKSLQQYGKETALKEMDKLVANENIMNILYDMYMESALLQANKTTRDINRSAKTVSKTPGVSTPDVSEVKGFGYNEEWITAIINYLRDNLLVKVVVPITDKTKQLIYKMLQKAQDEGWGADETAKRIADDRFSLVRAKLIVRTEMVQAANLGDRLAASKSKWELNKTWVAASDERTRHSHRIVDGDTIQEDALFKVPIFKRVMKVDVQIGDDYMTGPGDPKATIGNLANCRCRAVYRARRDQNGRLIPKTQSLIIQS